MQDILETLIKASVRAACIAKSCTASTSGILLETEKGEAEANSRFEKDYKTIADVLAQECAKREIALSIPSLAKYVRGEESNEINGVTITLQDTEEETIEMLNSLLPLAFAKQIAKAVHNEIDYMSCTNVPNAPLLNPDDIGIWIDPIDATAEFIAGVRGNASAGHGLLCVTVLIGAYLKSSGEPIIGVINQPFYNCGMSRIIWGVNYKDIQLWPDCDKKVGSENNIVLVSGAENKDVVDKLKRSGWKIKVIPGAGHKLLKVVLGKAAAYIVSKGTTFRWDTCAPHAILNAKGGGIISFSTHKPIMYNDDDNLDTKEYCNSEGIIAYADKNTLSRILNTLNHDNEADVEVYKKTMENLIDTGNVMVKVASPAIRVLPGPSSFLGYKL